MFAINLNKTSKCNKHSTGTQRKLLVAVIQGAFDKVRMNLTSANQNSQRSCPGRIASDGRYGTRPSRELTAEVSKPETLPGLSAVIQFSSCPWRRAIWRDWQRRVICQASRLHGLSPRRHKQVSYPRSSLRLGITNPVSISFLAAPSLPSFLQSPWAPVHYNYRSDSNSPCQRGKKNLKHSWLLAYWEKIKNTQKSKQNAV